MKQHKEILIKYSIEKSIRALDAAEKNLEIDLNVSQNRVYYAIFYIVLALAYLDDFATGKHHKLMGWFNKKYIHEDKIFKSELSRIYSKLLSNRETFDYNVSENPNYKEVQQDLEKAKFFVETVKEYILKKTT
jgi:uncharacterized protein (UPF0332 family)